MNRFVVIGLGNFGEALAERLYSQGKEVIAIDIDKDAVQRLADSSSEAICANATDKNAIESLGIDDADVAIVSLGERIDVITLAALHLKEIGIPYLIVKAVSDDHEKILRAIGVDEIIRPEEFAAMSLATRLSLFGAADFLPILPNYSAVLLKNSKSLQGKKISSLEDTEVQIVAVQRGNEVILVPNDETILESDDTLIVLGENKRLNDLAERFEMG